MYYTTLTYPKGGLLRFAIHWTLEAVDFNKITYFYSCIYIVYLLYSAVLSINYYQKNIFYILPLVNLKKKTKYFHYKIDCLYRILQGAAACL